MRHGTTTLFVALDIATGEVIARSIGAIAAADSWAFTIKRMSRRSLRSTFVAARTARHVSWKMWSILIWTSITLFD
ncbi:hypothetical protein WT83_10780 [Burkholderia territorii]|uniref:Transposase n=1 Tax=Burkholderia territorii TaxID=1503055 RepID=A0A108EXL2_9BURK|nr:hypothetical protein WT83_10780 [Burkholderia territorii]